MNTLFKNRYRTTSHRLPQWDYSWNGFYFITLVTQHRSCNQGNIHRSTMKLSEWGNIIEREWFKSFSMRDELNLDEWVIMPNHIHAILVIENHNIVETHGRASPFHASPFRASPFRASLQRVPHSISSFIAGFKSAVNSRIDDSIDARGLQIPKFNRHNHFFQPNYHDHIIRNESEYHYIKNYIRNNPSNWCEDSLNLADTE